MKKLFALLLVIVLLSSCTTQYIAPQEPCHNIKAYSPNYSIKITDPNLTSPDRLASRYNEILCSSPIPVYVMPLSNFVSGFVSKITMKNNLFDDLLSPSLIFNIEPIEIKSPPIVQTTLMGLYFKGRKIENWPSEFIYINPSRGPHEVIASFFHEIGHYECVQKRCFCISMNTEISEYHAMVSQIDKSIKNKTPLALFYSYLDFHVYLRHPDQNDPYSKASKMLYNSEHWIRMERYFKYYGITLKEMDDVLQGNK